MGGMRRELNVVVLIVTYKSAAMTVANLAALRLERATPGIRLRAIVVDNASGDLPEIERAVAKEGWSDWVTLVAAPRNGGFAYGNNLGLQHAYASGAPHYIHLLNPDAQVRSGAVEALTSFLETHREVGIAGSSFETGHGEDWPYAFRFPGLASEIDSGLQIGVVSRLLQRYVVARRMDKSPQQIDWVSGASMMIRAEMLAAVGGLDENYFLYFEETDFCRRARRAGFLTWYVPGSRVMHVGGHSTQVTSADGASRRFPSYWFESRRRYFAVTFGVPRAMLIDVAAICAHSIGLLKRALLLRARTAKPHFIRDLIRHSVLWPRHRRLPPLRCFMPPRE